MEGLAPGFQDFGLEAVLTAIGIVGIESDSAWEGCTRTTNFKH